MSFPYLDLLGVQRRSFLRPKYFDEVETQSPGFTVQSIASHSSSINSRLRKRYGNALPFGQGAPPLVPSGLTPPQVTLSGRPTLGSYLMILQVTTGGALGTAIFKWSSDGGYTWTTGVTTAATVLLGSTGMTANFPSVGVTYDTSNAYAAAPPVPETILKWVTTLVTADVFRRHGVNPNDPLMVGLVDEVIVECNMEESREGELQWGQRTDGTPIGVTSGLYTPGPFTFKAYVDSGEQICQQLAIPGLGSFGNYLFTFILEIFENPLLPSLTIQLNKCKIEKRKFALPKLSSEWQIGLIRHYVVDTDVPTAAPGANQQATPSGKRGLEWAQACAKWPGLLWQTTNAWIELMSVDREAVAKK